jgi:integrase
LIVADREDLEWLHLPRGLRERVETTSSSGARSPTSCVAGCSPATSPSSPLAPALKAIQKTEGRSSTDEQLRRFLRAAAGHHFFPIPWLAATTGMRHNEVLGLKWPDNLEERSAPALLVDGRDLH